MLSEFFIWWTDQLRSLIPPVLKAGVAGEFGRRALVVSVAGPMPARGPVTIELALRRRDRSSDLGRFTLDPVGVAALRDCAARHAGPYAVLRLPTGLLLEQAVDMPLAAERNLGRVLQYEMDRLTPFTADELFWTWSVLQRDRSRVHLLLSVIPQARLATELSALREAGIRPDLIEAPSASTGVVRRILLARPSVSTWQRRRVRLLEGACAALAVAVVAAPFALQSIAIGQADDRIAAARPKVDRAEALRRAIARNAAGSDVVEAQRAKVGDMLQILATLTDVLPDDTYLLDLAVRARSLTLSGQSAAAARLIAALAQDGAIDNPAFAAPVTRAQGGGGEGFTIRAEMVR